MARFSLMVSGDAPAKRQEPWERLDDSSSFCCFFSCFLDRDTFFLGGDDEMGSVSRGKVWAALYLSLMI